MICVMNDRRLNFWRVGFIICPSDIDYDVSTCFCPFHSIEPCSVPHVGKADTVVQFCSDWSLTID